MKSTVGFSLRKFNYGYNSIANIICGIIRAHRMRNAFHQDMINRTEFDISILYCQFLKLLHDIISTMNVFTNFRFIFYCLSESTAFAFGIQNFCDFLYQFIFFERFLQESLYPFIKNSLCFSI
jgi:hypothetical protein